MSRNTAALENTAEREFLRHTLATLAYRGLKSVLDVPDDFGEFKVGASSRTPGQILAHVGDLLQWAICMDQGEHKWSDSEPLPWSQEVARFQELLRALDAQLARPSPLSWGCEKLFQGPIADALTHVGQINMLRRLAGQPVRGENYARADIRIGQVEPNTMSRRVEFD